MSSFTVRQSIEAMEEYAVEITSCRRRLRKRLPSAPHASRLTVIRQLNRKTCAK